MVSICFLSLMGAGTNDFALVSMLVDPKLVDGQFYI
ncbi:MAG: hypothetical protein CM15mP78_16760 [Candidatus Poseidoniales archaeon]|nr:MAG: hypothetical protein CM15mP78_16760 [Candidatus Poseidoniales archaeon]